MFLVRALRRGDTIPRVETLGFYEADFVKTRVEIGFFCLFLHF